jgi:hypothetical protein
MKRVDSLIALSLFIASFTLYIRTLAPSLLYGDSAEFQTIAYTLGVGHPTGYPIYVLLAKLFTFLPVGEIAYRVNLFSAFCAALTVGLMYLTLRTLGALVIPSICGGLALALTSLFWKQASIAEIYAPSVTCLAFVLLTLFRWRDTNHPRWVFMAGLVGGLSLGIHTTVALSGIPVLLYLVLLHPDRATWLQALFGTMIGLALFFLAFLFLDLLNSPAGYYNSVVRPSLSVWGMTPENFDSPFERFAFLYFPPQFREQFFGAAPDEILSRITHFASEGGWSLSLSILGFISLWLLPRKTASSRWREAILLTVALILFFGFAVTYNVDDFYVYYVPVILLLVLFMALGIHTIIEWTRPVFTTLPFVPTGLSILVLLVGFFPLTQKIAAHWQERIPPGLEDWEGYMFRFPEIRRQEAEKIVSRLEDNAIVFTDWDQAYDFYYVAYVLQVRREMSFHETYPQEGVSQFADSAIEYIEANIDYRPIYFSERPSQLATRYKITRTRSGLFQIEKK